MPRPKSNIKKQRLNTTVKVETVEILKVLGKLSRLDQGALIDELALSALKSAGLTLEETADTPTPDLSP